MVAELDEPEEQNCVHKHALQHAKDTSVRPMGEAATSIFSNASISYSSNVNLVVENSLWNDEKQLRDIPAGHVLELQVLHVRLRHPGIGMTEKRKVLFEMALNTTDATFQNLDSSEILLTDVSHYFDSDPTNLLQQLRKDGKKPGSYVADMTTTIAQVRTLPETVRLNARTKLLNPKWYEGMMLSGNEGMREIEKRLTNMVGWSATSGQGGQLGYLEASRRDYWETSKEKLRQLYSEVEDKIEGIYRPVIADTLQHSLTLDSLLF